MSQASRNKELKFKSARGIVRLTVLAEDGEVYIVCRPEEYEQAKREGRKPLAVGFKKSDAIEKDA
jgi:hypothetical protein